jgi:hypothetical protein
LIPRNQALSPAEHQLFPRALILSHSARARPAADRRLPFFNSVIKRLGLPVICIDARHEAVLKMQINKSGRNDAIGIARIMRTDLSNTGMCGSIACSVASPLACRSPQVGSSLPAR